MSTAVDSNSVDCPLSYFATNMNSSCPSAPSYGGAVVRYSRARHTDQTLTAACCCQPDRVRCDSDCRHSSCRRRHRRPRWHCPPSGNSSRSSPAKSASCCCCMCSHSVCVYSCSVANSSIQMSVSTSSCWHAVVAVDTSYYRRRHRCHHRVANSAAAGLQGIPAVIPLNPLLAVVAAIVVGVATNWQIPNWPMPTTTHHDSGRMLPVRGPSGCGCRGQPLTPRLPLRLWLIPAGFQRCLRPSPWMPASPGPCRRRWLCVPQSQAAVVALCYP